MRGRKPKTVERQIAEGDPRKHGTGKLQERLQAKVKARVGLPQCPRHLRGRARACWNMWKLELELMGLDSRPDAMMLEGACVHYARAVQADRQVVRFGITVEEPVVNGEGEEIGVKIKKNPAVEVSNRSWLIARAFCSEFGLSPVSRTRLTNREERPRWT
jgi:P27 family predicted phage terminase small subunit